MRYLAIILLLTSCHVTVEVGGTPREYRDPAVIPQGPWTMAVYYRSPPRDEYRDCPESPLRKYHGEMMAIRDNQTMSDTPTEPRPPKEDSPDIISELEALGIYIPRR